MALVSNSSLTLLFFFFLPPSVSSDWFCALPSSRPWVGPQRSQQHDVHHHVLLVAPRLRLARRGRALLCRLLVRTCSIASRSAAFESRMSIINYNKIWCMTLVFVPLPVQRGPLQIEEDSANGDGTFEAQREGSWVWGWDTLRRTLGDLHTESGRRCLLYYRDESWRRRDTDTVSGHLTYLYLCLI